MAAAPAAASGATARQAAATSAKSSQAVARWRASGRVRKVASAMKARVPSEPTTSFSRTFTGVSASRKALRL